MTSVRPPVPDSDPCLIWFPRSVFLYNVPPWGNPLTLYTLYFTPTPQLTQVQSKYVPKLTPEVHTKEDQHRVSCCTKSPIRLQVAQNLDRDLVMQE